MDVLGFDGRYVSGGFGGPVFQVRGVGLPAVQDFLWIMVGLSFCLSFIFVNFAPAQLAKQGVHFISLQLAGFDSRGFLQARQPTVLRLFIPDLTYVQHN